MSQSEPDVVHLYHKCQDEIAELRSEKEKHAKYYADKNLRLTKENYALSEMVRVMREKLEPVAHDSYCASLRSDKRRCDCTQKSIVEVLSLTLPDSVKIAQAKERVIETAKPFADDEWDYFDQEIVEMVKKYGKSLKDALSHLDSLERGK